MNDGDYMFFRNSLLTSLLLVTFSGSALAQASKDSRYAFCSTSFGDSMDRKWVVSSVFKVDSTIYMVGVQNSFRSYVDAEFGTRSASPVCTRYLSSDSYQTVQDARNDDIFDLKNRDWPVHTVHWSYHGD